VAKISDRFRRSRSARAPIHPAWNCQGVEDRVLEAGETLLRLADLDRHRACLPLLATTARTEGPHSPLSHLPEVERMREALTWLGWLEPDVARLMLARAQGVSWKAVAHYFGISVRTAQRQRRYALSIILWRLHGRRIPHTWSRHFLLSRVAALSRGL